MAAPLCYILPGSPVLPLTRALPTPKINTCAVQWGPSRRPTVPSLRAPFLRQQYSSTAGMSTAVAGNGGGGRFIRPTWNNNGGGDSNGDDGGFNAFNGGRTVQLLVAGLFAKYSRQLVVRPYRTKAITTGILMMISDYLAQKFTEPGLEIERLLRYLFYGAIIAGPATAWWFSLLETRITVGGLRGALHMAALDQVIGAPILLATFILFMHLAEGQRISGNEDVLREKHSNALLASVRVWPWVNTFNFALVPSQYRVVFGSIFNVFWIAFLSVTNAGKENAPVQPELVLDAPSTTGG